MKRRGFVLVSSLLTMVLVLAFVAVAWMIVNREFKSSQSGGAALRASEAAEYGATRPMSDWRRGDALAWALGEARGPYTATLAGGATASWRVQRTSSSTFVAQGDGAFQHAHRTVTAYLRLALPGFDTTAALTVRDSAFVRAGGSVSGADVSPASWIGLGCPNSGGGAGVAAPDTTHICDGPCQSPSGGIVGMPARHADSSAAGAARFAQFGSETWSTLTSRADLTLLPNSSVTPGFVLTGGTCDRSVVSNWGDPARASVCSDWFPVIHALGDVTVVGGSGQGILLAEGDVVLSAGARFIGVIVSRDDVRLSTGGARVTGAVLAEDRDVADGVHPDIAAGGIIERSTCAIARATLGSAPLQRVRERSWAPVYD